MVIILLSGGLGNQLFQYSFFLKLKSKLNNVQLNDCLIRKVYAHNGLELTNVFDLAVVQSPIYLLLAKLISKLYYMRCNTFLGILSLFKIYLIKETGDAVYSDCYFKPVKGISFYWGYWQSSKYFCDITEEIRRDFAFPMDKLSVKSLLFIDFLKHSNSVSLHVRRGDYFSDEIQNIYGNICTMLYYEKAVSYISQKLDSPYFVIFSDDIDWVKQHMNLPNAQFVDWNTGVESWQDMCLMSNCKHNIIANSSFSWWGAWLNANPDKIVVAPSRFLNNSTTPDILPDEWIKIPV